MTQQNRRTEEGFGAGSGESAKKVAPVFFSDFVFPMSASPGKLLFSLGAEDNFKISR